MANDSNEINELKKTIAKASTQYHLDFVAVRYLDYLKEIEKWSNDKTDICKELDPAFEPTMIAAEEGIEKLVANNEEMFELVKQFNFRKSDVAFRLYGLGKLYEEAEHQITAKAIIAVGYEMNKKYNFLAEL